MAVGLALFWITVGASVNAPTGGLVVGILAGLVVLWWTSPAR